jgi:hypothetical protein
MIASLLALTLCLSAPETGPSFSPAVAQAAPLQHDPQKLRRAVGIKWLGVGVAVVGGATLTMPVVIAGGALSLFGIIAQDVHTVRLSDSHAQSMGVDQTENESMEQVAQDIQRVQPGTLGMFAVSRSYRTAFLVLDIVSERENDKVLRIEYTNERGERVEKLVRASNAKITYTDY